MCIHIFVLLKLNFQVWKKVVYIDRLLQLFRYVPREQLSIPDFVFQLSVYVFTWHHQYFFFFIMLFCKRLISNILLQKCGLDHRLGTNLLRTSSIHRHDLEVNGGTGLIVDPRTKYVYNRPWHSCSSIISW